MTRCEWWFMPTHFSRDFPSLRPQRSFRPLADLSVLQTSRCDTNSIFQVIFDSKRTNSDWTWTVKTRPVQASQWQPSVLRRIDSLGPADEFEKLHGSTWIWTISKYD
ncbi:hypothetical protein PM082_008832 [Marasmius tenuissimus]|nr:hypothetical protein PM082_008832 [Marasmius tenuissimus]